MSEAAGRRERGALRALDGEAQMTARARPEGICGYARRRLFSGLYNFTGDTRKPKRKRLDSFIERVRPRIEWDGQLRPRH